MIFLHKLVIIIPDIDLERVNNQLYVTTPITQFLEQQKYFAENSLKLRQKGQLQKMHPGWMGELAVGTDCMGRISLKHGSRALISGKCGIIYNIVEVKI